MAGGIVVGTDGSATAMAAVDEAARLAQSRGEMVHLVSAYGAPAMSAFAPEAAVNTGAEDLAAKALEEARQRCAALGVDNETYAVQAPAAQAIVDVAKTHDASVIVVGSRGMRGARRFLGSVPNAVTHHAHCSVFVVRTD